MFPRFEALLRSAFMVHGKSTQEESEREREDEIAALTTTASGTCSNLNPMPSHKKRPMATTLSESYLYENTEFAEALSHAVTLKPELRQAVRNFVLPLVQAEVLKAATIGGRRVVLKAKLRQVRVVLQATPEPQSHGLWLKLEFWPDMVQRGWQPRQQSVDALREHVGTRAVPHGIELQRASGSRLALPTRWIAADSEAAAAAAATAAAAPAATAAAASASAAATSSAAKPPAASARCHVVVGAAPVSPPRTSSMLHARGSATKTSSDPRRKQRPRTSGHAAKAAAAAAATAAAGAWC